MSLFSGKIWNWIIPVAILAAGIFYYFFDPSASVYAPKCVLREITGYQCPGCGFQRAAHAFLHGRVLEAVSYNLFFIVAIPYLIVLLYSTVMIHRKNPSSLTVKLYNFATSRYTLYSYIALYMFWWILRNILNI